MTTPTRTPRFNPVGMSIQAELLGDEGRRDIVRFYDEVFGWKELPTETVDGKKLVLSAYTYEQFVFLIADDPPMECPRLDHFGMSVDTEQELVDMLARAKAFQARDDRVDIVDREVTDHGMLAISSFDVRSLPPMMVEIEWWDLKKRDEPA